MTLPVLENLNLKRALLLLITGVGIILFWGGVWEMSAKLFSEEVSIVIGVVILGAVALIERCQLFKFFGGGF